MTARHRARQVRRELRRTGRPDLQHIVVIAGYSRDVLTSIGLKPGQTRDNIQAISWAAAAVMPDRMPAPIVDDEWWAYYVAYPALPYPTIPVQP